MILQVRIARDLGRLFLQVRIAKDLRTLASGKALRLHRA